MMEAARQWLLGVLSVCLVCALADALMPRGGVKRVGQLVCGLVMALAILAPAADLDLDGGQRWLEDYLAGVGRREEELEEQVSMGMKTIIEEQYAAYIADKAAGLGLSCAARVTCESDGDGLWLPVRAELTGAAAPEDRARLSALLEAELGLAAEQIRWTAGEGAA